MNFCKYTECIKCRYTELMNSASTVKTDEDTLSKIDYNIRYCAECCSRESYECTPCVQMIINYGKLLEQRLKERLNDKASY